MSPPAIKCRTESGIVWERIAKRIVSPGDYHWCGESRYPVLATADTPAHLCGIWQESDDQDWQPPEPIASDNPSGPIDELIERVSYSTNLNEMHVLGVLYQAKALEEIAFQLGSVPAELPQIGHDLNMIKVYLTGFNPYKTVLMAVVALALLDLLAFLVMVIVK